MMGQKGTPLRASRDPELLRMVEQYLIANANKTYVDIEDMVSALQTKSYRYSRMKRQVFVGIVKDAYHNYCNDNKKSSEVLMYTPHTENSAKNSPMMDDIVVSDISDSDIEIEEQQPKSAMNIQMTDLYKRSGNATAIKTASPKKSPAKGSKPAEGNEGLNSNSSTASGGSFTEPVSPTELGGTEDDLEIIDEFNGGSRNLSSSTADRALPNGRSNSVSIVPQISTLRPIIKNLAPAKPEGNQAKSTISSHYCAVSSQPHPNLKSSLKNSNQQVEDTPKSNIDKRGIKRRTVAFEEDENRVSPPPDPPRQLKRAKTDKAAILVSETTFADFGGSEKVIEEICKLLMHLKHPEIYQTLGITPPRGFMLHGPPGCGKTLLANAIAGELKLPMLKMTATELISGISGESENNIRQLFDQALGLAPCVIFIDEIDSITPKRETAQREMEKRIVAQLLACIDDLSTKERGNQVLLIGATNRIESIDSALRRAGRFDREICLGIPDLRAREKIIRVLSRSLRLGPDFKISTLAKLTPGYVGADIQALLREAAVESVNNVLNKSIPSNSLPTETEPENATSIETLPEKNHAEGNIPSTVNLEIMEVDTSDEDKTKEIIDSDSKVNVKIESASTHTSATAVDVDEGSSSASAVPAPVDSTGSVNSEKCVSESIPGGFNQGISPIRWLQDLAPLDQSQLDGLFISMKDFEAALKRVQPSSKREGFATVPDTTWDDIGALREIRDELEVSILGPVKYFSAFQALGLTTPAGVLLCGPPGCGKTLLAKAVANEAGINFISVKGPELLNMYVGESERAVRQCFLRAKNSSPCVIFFDELDALCPRRSEGPESSSTSRVVNQLLTEMDGMESRTGVFVMAATNRPDIIDPAVLRPGRLDKVLFVSLPSPTDRVDILKAITKSGSRPVFGEDVDLESIGMGETCNSYTGADLAALVREASIAAFRELVLEAGMKNQIVCKDEDLKVYHRHFVTAFTKTKPSVSKKDQENYAQMKDRYSSMT